MVELWLSILYSGYNGAMIAHLAEIIPASIRAAGFAVAYSLATAVFASLEAWMSKGGEDIDELSRLTDIALSALEDGLTQTLRHTGLD